MTKKLYYDDQYRKTFTADVINQEQDDANRWYVTLDRTAFYPTGGGQPHDSGVLNDIPVVDVEEIDGEIRHYIKSPLAEREGIHGEIDWQRRFDHMQQHAGQHVLSAACEELFGLKTISFHLGKDTCTIDLDSDNVEGSQLTHAEDYANQIIVENRRMETRWVSEEESKRYPLRKTLSVKDNIRLVIIPDFDYNGCGGTHPNSTGEIIAIKILNRERQRKKTRITFVCGNRVLQQLGQHHETIRNLGQLLNASEQGLVAAVNQLLAKEKQTEKTLKQAREDLLSYESEALVWNAADQSFISAVYKNRTMKELKKLTQLVVVKNREAVVVLISENENKLQFVLARGNAFNHNMKNVLNEVLPHINGKGGGSESIAQGGGELLLSGEQLLTEVKKVIGM